MLHDRLIPWCKFGFPLHSSPPSQEATTWTCPTCLRSLPARSLPAPSTMSDRGILFSLSRPSRHPATTACWRKPRKTKTTPSRTSTVPRKVQMSWRRRFKLKPCPHKVSHFLSPRQSPCQRPSHSFSHWASVTTNTSPPHRHRSTSRPTEQPRVLRLHPASAPLSPPRPPLLYLLFPPPALYSVTLPPPSHLSHPHLSPAPPCAPPSPSPLASPVLLALAAPPYLLTRTACRPLLLTSAQCYPPSPRPNCLLTPTVPSPPPPPPAPHSHPQALSSLWEPPFLHLLSLNNLRQCLLPSHAPLSLLLPHPPVSHSSLSLPAPRTVYSLLWSPYLPAIRGRQARELLDTSVYNLACTLLQSVQIQFLIFWHWK